MNAFSLTPIVLIPPSHSAATTAAHVTSPRFLPATRKLEDELDEIFRVVKEIIIIKIKYAGIIRREIFKLRSPFFKYFEVYYFTFIFHKFKAILKRELHII